MKRIKCLLHSFAAFLFTGIAAGLFVQTFVSCSNDPLLVSPEGFMGSIGGKETGLWTISNEDMVLQATNYGGRVVSLWVPKGNGEMVDVVLGYGTLDEYVNYRRERFLGAVVGPVANRIVGASYSHDGRTYRPRPPERLLPHPE